jgi:hypothetical protein
VTNGHDDTAVTTGMDCAKEVVAALDAAEQTTEADN